MDAVITAEGLTRRFGAVTAVDGLSFEAGRGEVLGFLGHNGAGKTTTVRLLNGVLAPSAGRATVLGLDPATDGAAVRRRTGVLTETPALDDRLPARVGLRFFAEVYGVSAGQVDARIDALLERFGLAGRADERVGAYSKGMRQRLALARTLIHDPELLFLDEPTAGLDPQATREVHQIISQLSREGRTVFLCTHNLVEAQRLCTRVAVLAQGRLLALGAPSSLAERLGRGNRLLLEVAPAQTEQATALLCGLPGVVDASPADEMTPGRLRVQGVPRPAIPAAVGALAAAGIELFYVAEDEPSLEDVYFALQENGAAQKETP